MAIHLSTQLTQLLVASQLRCRPKTEFHYWSDWQLASVLWPLWFWELHPTTNAPSPFFSMRGLSERNHSQHVARTGYTTIDWSLNSVSNHQ